MKALIQEEYFQLLVMGGSNCGKRDETEVGEPLNLSFVVGHFSFVIVIPKSSILNPQSSILNPQSSFLNPNFPPQATLVP